MVLALAACALAGCGGQETRFESVPGRGFTFQAPADWKTAVQGRSSSATGPSPELVSVRVFPLARPYRPDLWASVVPELDRVADQLASRLDGEVEASVTVIVDGRRARRYDISYRLRDAEVVERTAFVLQGRREFQLVCRYRAGDPSAACSRLFESFRVV